MPDVNVLDPGSQRLVGFIIVAVLFFVGGLVGKLVGQVLAVEKQRIAKITEEALAREETLRQVVGGNTQAMRLLETALLDQKQRLNETVQTVADHTARDNEAFEALRQHVDDVAHGTRAGLDGLTSAVEGFKQQLAAMDARLQGVEDDDDRQGK